MSRLEQYPNILELLRSNNRRGSDAEETLSNLRDHHLETIDNCLSVVDLEEEPTKDWIDEFNKNDHDRTTSAFAEILLLYHLRDKFGEKNVKLNARITEESNSKDFDLKLSLDDEIWIEVVKRDFASNIPEEGGFISTEGTGKTIDNKLKGKFEKAKNEISKDETLILSVYLEEMMGQSLQIEKWLNQEYYDISDLCDGLITYTHLTETRFKYYAFTDRGEKALEKIHSKLNKNSENLSS